MFPMVIHVLGVSEIHFSSHKWFESLGWTSWLETHFSTYVNLSLSLASSIFLCCVYMCVKISNLLWYGPWFGVHLANMGRYVLCGIVGVALGLSQGGPIVGELIGDFMSHDSSTCSYFLSGDFVHGPYNEVNYGQHE